MAESDPPKHPLAHVPPDKCYEMMLSERAALVAACQGRQDSLVTTVTQISSAALLIIPGLFLGQASPMPTLEWAPLIYFGIFGFVLALFCSLAEQHFSAVAYQCQLRITEDYYLQKSTLVEDGREVTRVRRTRATALVAFTLAILFSTLGLAQLG